MRYEPKSQLYIAHGVREGVRIIGVDSITENDISIDIIVETIGGVEGTREATFGVSGVPGIEKLQLGASEQFRTLTQDLKMRIRRVTIPKSSEALVPVHYESTENYIFQILKR